MFKLMDKKINAIFVHKQSLSGPMSEFKKEAGEKSRKLMIKSRSFGEVWGCLPQTHFSPIFIDN